MALSDQLGMTLHSAIWRLHFAPDAEIQMGDVMGIWRGKFGNALRAVCGDHECSPAGCPLSQPCLRARLFEGEVRRAKPSGFGSAPRPYVLRSFHLHGRRLRKAESFFVDLHLFDTRNLDNDRPRLLEAFLAMAATGLRGDLFRVGLRFLGIEALPLPEARPMLDGSSLTIQFLSPTELLDQGTIQPGVPFDTLMRRLRDRISALAMLYGNPIEDCNFRNFAAAAQHVKVLRDDSRWLKEHRNSTRTGQHHWLSGWIGNIVYQNVAPEYLPWIVAGQVTGVGEQTAFGKGAYRIVNR